MNHTFPEKVGRTYFVFFRFLLVIWGWRISLSDSKYSCSVIPAIPSRQVTPKPSSGCLLDASLHSGWIFYPQIHTSRTLSLSFLHCLQQLSLFLIPAPSWLSSPSSSPLYLTGASRSSFPARGWGGWIWVRKARFLRFCHLPLDVRQVTVPLCPSVFSCVKERCSLHMS